MNHIILIGNLVHDPKTGSTPNGTKFTQFSIAVGRPYTSASGERETDYFDVTVWRTLAERCAKYLFKGNKVGVSGPMQQRQYTGRDGVKRTAYDVIADEVEFLTPKQGSEQQPKKPEREPTLLDGMMPVSDDEARDLPF